MFYDYKEMQFSEYNKSVNYYKENYYRLITIEQFVMCEIIHFIDLHLPEITRDYNEASNLYSFWKNYPPLDRGRSPVGDQYPWSKWVNKCSGTNCLGTLLLISE